MLQPNVLTRPEDAIWHWIAMLDRCNPQSGIEAFMRAHARPWQAQALDRTLYIRGEARQCFGNSQSMAVTHRDLTYVEGYAIHGDIPLPVAHGWLVDAEGRVIDVTWEQPEASVYIGIPFQTAYLKRLAYEHGMWCSLLDHDYSDHALLRGLHPVATAVKDWPHVAA